LSVRKKDSLVRTDFYDILQKQHNSYPYQVHVRTVLGVCPDVSLDCSDGQVLSFFISFPTTPISSQSDTQTESYDKNTETCAESFLKSVRTVFPFSLDGCCFPIRASTRNPISTRTLNGLRTVLPHRPDGCTWTLDSSRTFNSVRTICHYVRTDAILNSSKFLDTDGCLDGKLSSSGQMLLTDERPDGIPHRPDGSLGSDFSK
jgi:hypothetical protein